jgi:hypothetical protein
MGSAHLFHECNVDASIVFALVLDLVHHDLANFICSSDMYPTAGLQVDGSYFKEPDTDT